MLSSQHRLGYYNVWYVILNRKSVYSDNDNEFKRVMLITAGGLGFFFFAFNLFFKPLHQRNKAKGNLKKNPVSTNHI